MYQFCLNSSRIGKILINCSYKRNSKKIPIHRDEIRQEISISQLRLTLLRTTGGGDVEEVLKASPRTAVTIQPEEGGGLGTAFSHPESKHSYGHKHCLLKISMAGT